MKIRNKLLFILLLFPLISLYISGEGRKIVVLDAGHGGSDSGIISGDNVEKNIDLKICKKIGDILKDSEIIKVIFTREGDVDESVENREIFANNGKGDLFISIHCGKFLSDKNFGIVYILDDSRIDTSNLLISQKIGDRVVKFFPYNIAGFYFLPKSSEFGNSLQRSLNEFYGENFLLQPEKLDIKVLKNLTMPGVLVEVCNLGSKDFKGDENWYDSISKLVSKEIVNFFSAEIKGDETEK